MASVAGTALTVEVLDTDSGVRQKYTFERTPVRVGRSPLNELPLDRPFVSHCHGVFHFDELRCEFVDLGSTNGTFLGTRQLAKNEPIPVTPNAPLIIGALEVRVSRGPSSQVDTRASYAFQPSQMREAVCAPAEAPKSLEQAAPAREELTRLVRQYRKAWDALMGALIQQGALGVSREALANELLAQCPELAQEAEFRRWLGTDTGTPSRPPPPISSAPAMNPEGRAGLVLERFAQTFLELRRGQRQFARQVGISAGGKELLGGVEDASELLRFLLDPSASSERIDELSRAFAELMLHQVALLNAFQAGAREVIAFLSPEALVKRARGGALGWLQRLLGRDPRLVSLQRSIEDLGEDTTLGNLLMGRAFARAYASAMGQDPGKLEPEDRNQTGRL
jgi:type VI secretion system protein ImpI